LAFKGTKNRLKLLCAIAISISGKRIRSYQRLRSLSSKRTFTAKGIVERYHLVGRSANLWIGNMRRRGLVTKVKRFRGRQFIRYRLTEAGLSTVELPDRWETEFLDLCRSLHCREPIEILEALKVRK